LILPAKAEHRRINQAVDEVKVQAKTNVALSLLDAIVAMAAMLQKIRDKSHRCATLLDRHRRRPECVLTNDEVGLRA
jgi:hypothetical protein